MSTIHYILDDDHNVVPCTMMEWAKWFEDNCEERIVKKTTLDDGRLVSTVFLGLDHNFGGGPMKVFETMIFVDNDYGTEDYCERYETWEQAEAGHVLACLRPADESNED